MAKDFTLLVGTIGSGLWLSRDGGIEWRRVAKGLWGESRVYGLSVHPEEPKTIFAGADDGLYRSEDGGESFEKLPSAMDGIEVWKIAFDPSDPRRIFAGTRPAALFRSEDGGAHWRRLAAEIAEECPNVRVPRVTALAVDPHDPRTVWAGIEVDGVRLSRDGGDSWTRVLGGLDDPDIHDVAAGLDGGKTVLATTPREIFASRDQGESWQGLGVGSQFRLRYCRSLAVKPDDPETLYVAAGDAAVGQTGAIERSQDCGKTWQALPLPVEPNSPIWAFATHRARPRRIFACSHYGEVYASEDAGDSWAKCPREFTEIRAIAWLPN